MSSQALQTMCQIIVVVGLLLAAFGGYGAYHYGQKVQRDNKAKTASAGVIQGDERAIERNLAIGGIKIVLTTSNNVVVRDNDEPVLSIRIENHQLYVTTVVRSESGEVIATMEDNKWLVNKNNYLDRNYTDNALEVKDQLGKVVLQVVNFGDVIHFAGVFHAKNGHVVSFVPLDDLTAAIEIRGSDEDLTLKIDPIFEYPSELHFEACPGMSVLEDIVKRGQSHFYFDGPINIEPYSQESEKIVRLV